MKYLKYLLKSLKNFLISISHFLGTLLIIVVFFILTFVSDGYTLEDLGINLNPFDYCNLTEVDYTAILHDEAPKYLSSNNSNYVPNSLGYGYYTNYASNEVEQAYVEITEYLTFDVHAASASNMFKEIWRELPEDYVDGVKVTYNVKSVTQILDDGTEIEYNNTSKMYWEDEDYTPGSAYYWHHSKGSGRYPDNDESLLIYIPWTYRDKLKFKIVYTMNNAALKYNDCSELYLSMYSGNTIKKLKSYKAQILIPNNLMPSEYYAYSFGTSKGRIPFEESNSKNPGYYTFSINLDKSDLKFNYHNRYIEFCLLSYGKDKHIFTQYAPSNHYTNDNALQECIDENEYYSNQFKRDTRNKFLLLTSSAIISVLIVFFTKQKYLKFKELYPGYEPEVDYEYFRDIPSDLDPIFASELVFMKDPLNENLEKKEEYAAILLSLVRKKYVTISKVNENRDWSQFNTLIKINQFTSPDPANLDYVTNESDYISNEYENNDLEPLSTSERLYLELLERYARHTNNEITLSSLQSRIDLDYEYTNAFVKNIEKKPALEIGVIGGYFEQAEYDKTKKQLKQNAKSSAILGMLFLVIINLISYFTPLSLALGAYTILGITLLWKASYLDIKSSEFVLLTQYGTNEQVKWRGLYNFLNSDSLLNEKEVHDLPLWEKYLIYATAFGISEKVVKAIKIHAVELNIDNSPILHHGFYIHSSYFHATSRSFGHSLHTVSRGGFSGHGYGGGGRRRWRRWRRPLILK